ncbi:MAG: CBS domain-containing protein [bacterium]|jgi:CBS domain-containing protein|nr:CBS domain-containing protein [bacterium]
MLVRSLLNQKGSEVAAAGPDESVQAALDRMIERRVGSLLVMEDGEVTGIVTERDVLRRGLGDVRKLREQRVGEIMTCEVVIATPDDSLQYLMGLMTRNRIRHVPVFAEGKLAGIVSIGDIIFALLEESEATNRYLHDYIAGSY